jgi:hypothetical protein
MRSIKPRAMPRMPTRPMSNPNPAARFAANAWDAADAEEIPDDITTKQTRKLTK